MSYITDTKQRILDTIRTLGRPSTDAVIDYVLSGFRLTQIESIPDRS